jgi:uncharacterized membrane protein
VRHPAPAPTTTSAAKSVNHLQRIPPGWSYNPSSWRERWPLIVLAAIGLLAALYTALAQLGVFPTMWDPFFGGASSYAVTHSAISRLLPVPDGVFGVIGYLLDLIFGALGGADRWRARPWAVLIFAVVIVALGIVSLALTILQGAVIGQWCTVCLISAAVSTLILGLGIGEALASLQYLARVFLDLGFSAAWRALWGMSDMRRRDLQEAGWAPAITTARRNMAPDVARWLQVIAIALGIWLMVSPAVLPSTAPGAVVARIGGPLAIWVGVLALRGVTRPFRALNVLTGMFLAITPWVVSNTGPLILSTVLVGWALIVIALPRGGVRERTGGGWWAAIQPELVNHASDQ